MPDAPRASSVALRTSDSMSCPAAGRTCMVTSRPMSDCQSLAVLTTSMAAPVVRAARKVMIATTAMSERPAIEPFGTIELDRRGTRWRDGWASRSSHGSCITPGLIRSRSVVDM